MLHLSGNALETTNTKLAAALSTVGIPIQKDHKGNPKVVTVTGGPRGNQVAFFFEEQSPCGLYKTRELMLAWDDDAWHQRNPEHPFAYIKVAFQNAERLTDYCRKRTPICFVQQGSKIAFLSLHASDELQKKVFRELKR